jgi:hypothetical protein
MGAPTTIPSSLMGDDQGEGRIMGYLRGLSERAFNWSDEDHKQAADYAVQRANEMRQLQGSDRMAKADLSGHIKELERTAQYHRNQIGKSSRIAGAFANAK